MLLKAIVALFLVAWVVLGAWLALKYAVLFGPHQDDPAETPGARSFGVAHIIAAWVGVFALTVYSLFVR